ncbi:hypothetical protein GCM10009798_20180 [Nocardioides panacihumi]|uniref:WD40 repeat domain-containing protein n=1 Tax=Nocardioides panacihumi TaxID=400774 RepID=A0ABN2QYI3_9ACTN
MTGQLRDLLEERADAVGFRPPDLAEIVAEGDRRVRRRRLRAVTAAAVVTAVVGGGAVVAGAIRHPDEVVTGGGLADAVTWSRGSTIHVGPDEIDVGFLIHGFLRTSSGFVLMDGQQSVWSVTDAGQRRIGKVGGQERLVADRNGTLAAWIDPADELVVFDQLAGTTRSFGDLAGTSDGGGVLALDGRTVYWRSGAGVVTVNADTGKVTPFADGRLQLFDVKNSVLAFADATRDLKVGSSLEDAKPIVAWSLDTHGGDEPVVLSPTGRWVAVAHIRVTGSGDSQEIESRLNVYDVRTHAATALHLPGGRWVAVPSVWLGDATLQVMGLFGNPPFTGDTIDPSLFSCSLPSGSCRRVATVGKVGAGYAIATLPDGHWSSDDQ